MRELQTHAARHGELLEGLLPDMQQFDSLWKVQQPREEQVSGLFNDAIDLFGEAAESSEQPQVARDAGQQAHAMWINHLRQWSRNEENAAIPLLRRSCTPPLVILSPGWVMPMFRKRSALPAACRKAALCSPPRVLARRNG